MEDDESSDTARVVPEIWSKAHRVLTSNLFLAFLSLLIFIGPNFLTVSTYYPFFFVVIGFPVVKAFFPEMTWSWKIIFSIGLSISLFLWISISYRWLFRTPLPSEIVLPFLSMFNILIAELTSRYLARQKGNGPIDH